MKITVKIIIYTLIDAFGQVDHAVVEDPSDSICIGGIGIDGIYHLYNGEGRHLNQWAKEFGMRSGNHEKEIEEIDVT